MGLTTAGRGNDRSGSERGVDIRPLLPEYHSTVYRDSFDTGDISGSGAAAGIIGDPTVVGVGRTNLHTGDREGGRRKGGVGGGGGEGGQWRYGFWGRQEVSE